jgi:outer membrane protein assembly factor BamB
MSDAFFRFADIEYGNSPTNENIVGVFRFEQGRQNRQGPFHIVVAEIDSALYAYEQLLDTINATVEQSRTLMAGMALDPFARFEKIIERVNEAVAVFQEQEPTPINWSRLNIFIIECSGKEICISGHGKLMNIFCKKNGEKFDTFDLCGSLEQPAETNPAKVFASLICGDMSPGDLFFVGTNNFERYKDKLRIKERLQELPPVSAATEIKRDLDKENILDDFVAVTISLHADDTPAFAIKKNTKQAEESLKRLQQQEDQVQKTLAPTISPLGNNNSETETMARPKIPVPIESMQKFWRKTLNKIMARRSRPTAQTENALRGLHAGGGSFFTTKKKIMIGGVLILFIFTAVSYSSWQRNKRTAAEQAAWEQNFAEVIDLRNRAENDLLYAKDAQAQAKINEANEIIAALDIGNGDRATRVQAVITDFDQLKNRLRKVIAITGISELYSLPVTAQDGMLSAPVLTADKAYVADNQNRKLIVINLASKEKKEVSLPDPAGRIVSGAIGDKSVVFMDNNGKFYAVDIANDAFTPLNSFTGSESINDLVLYNKRAYVLDADAGQIHRLNAVSAGFSGATAYLSEGDEVLKNAVSFAIDSNVYAAKSDGTIIKYLSGQRQAFGLGTVDPAVRSVSAIWTETDDARLLVTDPGEKRLLIFDKNGLLTSQLTSNEFGILRDITSRLSAKQALLISDNRLLLVPLP